ncbi:Regulatory protein AfsR [Streptomyces sp. enrichment culture]|uniref:AfsR/SARP family transcriptional regulator n=1 Tax=Streptomyces sp. enrichment culture TaxID=1795815 RepID=UPI003F562E9C
MEFEIRLSGSVDVRVAGHRGDLGSTKTRLALAALAWDAGRTVSVDTLVHRIWDEHPPAKAREALHAHVSRIRRVLRNAGDEAPAIVSRTNSYVMHVDPDRVDLLRYTRRVRQGRVLRDDGEDEAALRMLDRADRLWHGEPLAGITGSWAGHLRSTVGETSLAAALTRAEILIGRERYAEAVAVLLSPAEEHPDDEALAERLAVALYGSSRTAEATRLLQRTRQRVVRDIGLDAGRRLHRVHQGILSGTPAAELLRDAGASGGGGAGAGRAPAEPLPGRPGRPAPVPDNLPRDVPWVGRRDELRRLGSAVREGGGTRGPVVTVEAIDGMGGVGKTSLAVHLAHRLRDHFPDGRLFLHLGGHAPGRTPPTPARALTELLRLLGMDVAHIPQDTDELVALWRSTVRDRRMLVILDDAVAPDQVRPLLPGDSPTAVVVTSRRRLPGLPGVRPLSLDVLPAEDAVVLFTQRLGSRRGHHETEAAETEEIIRICGYLPLAIEIAASRLLARPSWTTSDLLRQLREGGGRMAELRDGERSMTDVIALSYRELNAEQQLVFRRAGLHFGVEFGPGAVAALTGLSAGAAERVLEELLAQHLVSEPTPHRFTMHDLLRDFARTLDENDDAGAREKSRRAVRDLVDYYVLTADRADRLAYPYRPRIFPAAGSGVEHLADADAAEQWLLTEGANLLDTLSWVADHGTEDQLAVTAHVLAEFLCMGGHLAAAEPPLRRAVAHWAEEENDGARARALIDLSAVRTRAARFEDGVAAAREALETARALGDPELESEALHRMVIPLWQSGRYAVARTLQQRSVRLLSRCADDFRTSRAYNLLGIVHLHLAEKDDALECFRSALSGFTRLGYDRGRYSALNNMAELTKKMGDPKAAELAYREAIGIAEKRGGKGDLPTLCMNLASVLHVLGDIEEALALYARVLPRLREAADRRGEAIALNGIGRAHRAAGRSEQALPQHLAALAVAREIHAAEEIDVLYDLARAEHDTGRVAEATAHLRESLRLSRSAGAPVEEARAERALNQLGASSTPVEFG